MRLEGKTAFVSGGSRGIGKAIAQRLYDEGATVYINARNAEELTKAAQAMDTKKNGKVKTLAFDVSDAKAVKANIQKIADDGNCLTILVNCAGINLRGPAETMDEETWDKVIDINLKSMFLISQAAFPMLSKNGGKIVNIGSLMCELGRPSIAPYTASKGGVRMLTKALACEWAPHNIQVNGINPGYIATEMTTPLMDNKEFNDFIINRTPARRWGNPSDIAGAVMFLVSPDADFITGHMLSVDGGILASL